MKKILDIYKKYNEIINYLIVGALTTFVSLIVYYGCVYTFLNPNNPLQLQIANILSWIAGVIFAYFTNRKFVFESTSKNKIKEFISFVISRISTLLLEMFIMWFFITLLGLNSDLYVVIFTIISQIAIIVGNYVLSKLFVFKK